MINTMTPWELEQIQIHSEPFSVGLVSGSTPETERLAQDVMKLCAEIKRLRLTYGEPWWASCHKTEDEEAAERKEYENSISARKEA